VNGQQKVGFFFFWGEPGGVLFLFVWLLVCVGVVFFFLLGFLIWVAVVRWVFVSVDGL